jgi:hypothetical protein
MDWRRRRRGEAGPAATRRRGSRAVTEWRRGRRPGAGGGEGIRDYRRLWRESVVTVEVVVKLD